MANLSGKFSNLFSYLGFGSSDYNQQPTPPAYDPEKPLLYYLDERPKANFNGPFDDNNIPLLKVNDKLTYFPILICFYALGQISSGDDKLTDQKREIFLNVSNWLTDKINHSGRWLNDLPKERFGLTAPFCSAMSQGLGISVLTRAFLITSDKRYLEIAQKALLPFNMTVSEGGVKTVRDGLSFYEEYPGGRPCHVLNGFIYSLFGLHDLAQTGSTEAKELFDNGVKTLEAWLPEFDCGFWSLYHIGGDISNPATYHYHRLHVHQLEVMSRLTANAVILEYQKKWDIYLKSRLNAVRTLPAKIRWLYSD